MSASGLGDNGLPSALKARLEELQQANGELVHIAALKEEFLDAINHQLRTPVTAIVECAELIRDGALGPIAPQHQPLVQTLVDNAARLSRLVEEALDLSLLRSGRRQLVRAPADLAALLARVQASRQGRAGRGCTIRFSCGALPPVYLDAAAIEEVMERLLHNALRHAPPASEILVQATAQDGWADVSVHDHGVELPPDRLPRLFEPFSHVQDAQAPGQHGSGLGLAFCRQVIERHRGTIRVVSDHGRGTTVTFSIPLATSRFLFEEACTLAREEAGEGGAFGLLLVALDKPRVLGGAPEDIESFLRLRTARGDRFAWLEDQVLAVLAVTDRVGFDTMRARLTVILREARYGVRVGGVMYPEDGRMPSELVEAARKRLEPVTAA